MKFTTRDLFWLILVFAVMFALLVQRQVLLREIASQKEELEAANQRASLPRTVTVNTREYTLEKGNMKLIVEFTRTGVTVKEEPGSAQ